MPRLNQRVIEAGAPPIPQVQAWGRAYDGSKGPLIDLCQAVPGYPPHPALLERLADAAGSVGSVRYGPILGDPALREAYAADVSATYGGQVGAGQVAITAGCNQAFFATLMLLAGQGDAVLLPTPWYWNHAMSCGMLGIEARALPCAAEDGFVPDPERAEALLDARVRAIVLVTPNNPTGAVYPPETVARFHELCRRRGIWLVLDETYRDFLPPGQARPHGALADPGWHDNVVQLFSFSKSYAVPGCRLGALACSAAMMPQLAKALDCLHICPQQAAQSALLWGLGALGSWRDANRAEMGDRAAAARRCFARIPGWRIASLGAYFAYVRHPLPASSAWEVVERLAVRHGVLALPGAAFAGPDAHVRFSFANIDAPGIGRLADRLAAVQGEAGLASLAAG